MTAERRRLLPRAVVTLLVVLFAVGTAAAQPTADEPIEARPFRVYYKPLAEAADVIEPLLSVDGSVTLRKRLNTLVVQDRVSVLDRVAVLLERFDQPPQDVEVTLTLFLGTDREDGDSASTSAGTAFTQEVRGILETLGDFTKWHDYQPLGSRSVTGVEGTTVTADLTEDYRVIFVVDGVDAGRGLVKFERVVLQRLERDTEGAETAEDLYSMGMVMQLNRLRVVGAASGPDSRRALFLTVQVRER
jgi:hypothetical protein